MRESAGRIGNRQNHNKSRKEKSPFREGTPPYPTMEVGTRSPCRPNSRSIQSSPIAIASPTSAMSAPFQGGAQPAPGFRVTERARRFRLSSVVFRLNHCWIHDGCDNSHRPTTGRAGLDADPKGRFRTSGSRPTPATHSSTPTSRLGPITATDGSRPKTATHCLGLGG